MIATRVFITRQKFLLCLQLPVYCGSTAPFSCRELSIAASSCCLDKPPASYVLIFLTWSTEIAATATKAHVRKMVMTTGCLYSTNTAQQHLTCWKPLISGNEGTRPAVFNRNSSCLFCDGAGSRLSFISAPVWLQTWRNTEVTE